MLHAIDQSKVILLTTNEIVLAFTWSKTTLKRGLLQYFIASLAITYINNITVVFPFRCSMFLLKLKQQQMLLWLHMHVSHRLLRVCEMEEDN